MVLPEGADLLREKLAGLLQVKKQKNQNGIMSIPENERPYEKCWMYGAGVLSDAELLAVILRSGSREESSLELARRILYQMGEDGLSSLYHLSMEALTGIKGIGKVKAMQLKCVAELSRRISKERSAGKLHFRDPASIAEYYMEDLRYEEQEKVLLVMLDTKGTLIGEHYISQGTVNAAMISIREIFVAAIARKAVSIVMLHNHPSGDPTPSDQDIELTKQIIEAGKMLGIPLLDHIVIGDGVYFSILLGTNQCQI